MVGLVLAGSIVALVSGNSRAQGDDERQTRTNYIAGAAVHHAFSEIIAQADETGNGLGAMGIADPMVLLDSQGNAVGEYRTVVQVDGTNNVVVSVAASPSFDDPLAVSSARAIISAVRVPLLNPGPAAVAIAGPVTDPAFPNMGDNEVVIDGGDQAAFSLTSSTAYDAFMDAMGDLIDQGDIDGTELTGAVTSTYEHDTAGSITLPVVLNSKAYLSSEDLNNYRLALRQAVLDLAAQADRTITSKINSNQTWGTAADPQISVIQANQAGSNNDFSPAKDGVTITGNGTLIINHTCKPKKLTLNWTGDVFVLGYDGDGSDLFYLRGTTATINGNLILLSSNNTEASLELKDMASKISNLTVNGNLLCLAEAQSHEAEVETEMKSKLTVNGMMGLYGSRIEIEASGGSSSIDVNGTLAVGMAQDLDEGITRPDDFEFEMTGKVHVTYDQPLATQALEGLSGLESDLNLDEDDDLAQYEYHLVGGGTGNQSSVDTLHDLDSLIAANGPDADYGFQP
jgi:hypothetical protein